MRRKGRPKWTAALSQSRRTDWAKERMELLNWPNLRICVTAVAPPILSATRSLYNLYGWFSRISFYFSHKYKLSKRRRGPAIRGQKPATILQPATCLVVVWIMSHDSKVWSHIASKIDSLLLNHPRILIHTPSPYRLSIRRYESWLVSHPASKICSLILNHPI